MVKFDYGDIHTYIIIMTCLVFFDRFSFKFFLTPGSTSHGNLMKLTKVIFNKKASKPTLALTVEIL